MNAALPSGAVADLPGDAPAAWQGDEYWASEVPDRKSVV